MLKYLFMKKVWFLVFLSLIFAIYVNFVFKDKLTVRAANLQATLVRTINTGAWSPNSPDPSGLEYRAATNTLVVTDSEVEEMPPYYQGKNVFEASLDGTLVNTYNTTSFSTEPTGLAINPQDGIWYSSNDSKKKVYVINLGSDNTFGTGDDLITSFSTSAFGSTDPEGLAYGNGKLYIADGVGSEVYVVDPGINGKFDGIAPSGDDTVTHFDTSSMTQADPEGIAFNIDNGNLYIVSNNGGKSANRITEVTVSGVVVNVIDISFLAARSTAGLAYAPGSNNPSVNNIYIAARGVDNNSDPNENDGKIYEISLSASPPPTPVPTATPIPSASPTPAITPTPSTIPTPSDNLLINGGFEIDANNDGRPDNWTSKPFFTRSNAVSYSGTYSGRHASTTDNGYSVTQSVNGIVPGKTYTFSAKTFIPPTTDTFTYKLQVRWFNANGGTISTKNIKIYTAQTNGWDEISANLVAPANTVRADIRMTPASLNTVIYSDDLTFK